MRILIVATVLAGAIAGRGLGSEPIPPAVIARYVAIDNVCAWPNLIVLRDGKIVTAYYAKGVENHERYHMGVAIWEPPAK